MTEPSTSSHANRAWDAMYREGAPPWETGRPSAELLRVLDQGLFAPGRVLELGCGTGANAVLLAKRGFDVVAVDSSPTAIAQARSRSDRDGVTVRWVESDIYRFAGLASQFDLVFDSGVYHFMRRLDLGRFLGMLWKVTQPGAHYLTFAGSTGESAEGGPPQVSEQELRRELTGPFEMVQLRPFRIESPRRPEGYLAWSCLVRRPAE